MDEQGDDLMNYEGLVGEALRGAMRLALQKVVDNGGNFPGNHHAYITFNTSYPGVVLSKVAAAKYPDEMTVALQHRFSGLHLSDDGFSVVLSFGGVEQRVNVPWMAISRFYDPSVQFLLQFDVAAPTSSGNLDLVDVVGVGENVIAFKGRGK